MKTAAEWIRENPQIEAGAPFICTTEHVIAQIQADAFKAGQEATMKWVGEECRRQTERLIGLRQNPEPLF